MSSTKFDEKGRNSVQLLFKIGANNFVTMLCSDKHQILSYD